MLHLVESYGKYPLFNSYENEFFTITIQKFNDFLVYERINKNSKDKYSTKLGQQPSEIIFQPSEPLFPTVNTTFLLLHFEEPLTLLPDTSVDVWVTLPIATSVIITQNGKYNLLDIIHFAPVKFALYGDAHKGKICRYWRTSIALNKINPDYFLNCMLNLNISNSTSAIIKLTKLVLDFAFLEILYKDQYCFSSAKARILGENIAETEFTTPTSSEGFSKNFDLLPVRKFSSPKFLMEFGI